MNYSDRCLGLFNGTVPPGTTPARVADTVRHKGLVPEEMLSFDSTITTVEQYYSPNPFLSPLLREGKRWLEKNDFEYEWLWKSSIPISEKQKKLMTALQYSPVGVSVDAWNIKDGRYIKLNEQDNHWTVCYGYVEEEFWKIFDSYEPYRKNLDWNYDFGMAMRYSIIKRLQRTYFFGFLSTYFDIWNRLTK